MSWGWDKYGQLRKWADGAIDDYDPDDAIAYPAGRDDLEFTVFASARDPLPLCGGAASATWPEFVEFCKDSYKLKSDRTAKLNAPAIIGGRCVGQRANKNIHFLSMICADFDIDPSDPRYRTFDDMMHHLMAQNLSCVAYTTASNTYAHNRYRVIMPLGRNVSPTIWPDVWQAANAKFNGVFDPATKATAGLAFLPRAWTGPNPKGHHGAYNDFASWDYGEPIISNAEIDAIGLAHAAQATQPPMSKPSGSQGLTAP